MVPALDQLQLFLQWARHLQQQVGPAKDLLGRIDHCGARLLVVGVAEAGTIPGLMLHENAWPRCVSVATPAGESPTRHSNGRLSLVCLCSFALHELTSPFPRGS